MSALDVFAKTSKGLFSIVCAYTTATAASLLSLLRLLGHHHRLTFVLCRAAQAGRKFLGVRHDVETWQSKSEVTSAGGRGSRFAAVFAECCEIRLHHQTEPDASGCRLALNWRPRCLVMKQAKMRVAFGLFLGACLVSLALSDVAADLHFGFGKAQEGRVQIPQGGTFEVTLDSNPTTGYSWAFSSSSNNVALVSNDFVRPQNSRLIGAGGKQVFVFKANGPDTLHLRYARAWENNAEPASSVSVQVQMSS